MEKERIFISVFLFFMISFCFSELPDWEWETEPQLMWEQNLVTYMSRHGSSLAVQSQDNGGGAYLVQRIYHQDSNLLMYYLDSEGETWSELAPYYGHTACLEIDPLTGNCFGVYDYMNMDEFEIYFFYNQAEASGDPMSWVDTAVLVTDSSTPSFTSNDVFHEPEIHIGKSPLGDEYRRLYVIGRNFESSDGEESLPSENAIIAFQDYNAADVEEGNFNRWNYTSIAQLDAWNMEEPLWADSRWGMSTYENYLICGGIALYDTQEPQQICFINDNYGVGEWQQASLDYHYILTNINEVFPGAVRVSQELSGWGAFNLVVTAVDEDLKAFWGNSICICDQIYGGYLTYNEENQMSYPKVIDYELAADEISFYDLYPQGANPSDSDPMLPWDLNEDGSVDNYDEQGNPLWSKHWPFMNPDLSLAYHNGEFEMASNNENGWLAYIWIDGTNAQAFALGDDEYADWENISELALCVSGDNGESWSDPLRMNGNAQSMSYVAALDGMALGFPKCDSEIEDLGNGEGLLHLCFMTDEDLEPSNFSNGATWYCSMLIQFETVDEVEDEVPGINTGLICFPNPFNPLTKISYTLKEDSDIALEVYNLKGQKITELCRERQTAGKHSCCWNASEYSSGLYFYRLTVEGEVFISKGILLK